MKKKVSRLVSRHTDILSDVRWHNKKKSVRDNGLVIKTAWLVEQPRYGKGITIVKDKKNET